MAAYVILYTIEVTDEALHAEFRKRVGPLLQAKGGKYLLRGDISEVIGGELTGHSRMAAMEFETALRHLRFRPVTTSRYSPQ